ncbi:hypothetical protein TNCV_213131 [Trichonephila clavipes]|nr:hypothetical protein TNCV_213131 [Trichonephila clavipes]
MRKAQHFGKKGEHLEKRLFKVNYRALALPRPKRRPHLWSGNIRLHLSERSSKHLRLQRKLYSQFSRYRRSFVAGRFGCWNHQCCGLLRHPVEIKIGDSEKKSELLRSGFLLLDYNAGPFSVTVTQIHISILGWDLLHNSPYIHDLASSDIHRFSTLKKNLARRHFGSNAEVKQAVKRFFIMQYPEIYLEGLLKPV